MRALAQEEILPIPPCEGEGVDIEALSVGLDSAPCVGEGVDIEVLSAGLDSAPCEGEGVDIEVLSAGLDFPPSQGGLGWVVTCRNPLPLLE